MHNRDSSFTLGLNLSRGRDTARAVGPVLYVDHAGQARIGLPDVQEVAAAAQSGGPPSVTCSVGVEKRKWITGLHLPSGHQAIEPDLKRLFPGSYWHAHCRRGRSRRSNFVVNSTIIIKRPFDRTAM